MNYARPVPSWLKRLIIVMALIMLVAGVALTSGYLGSPATPVPTTTFNQQPPATVPTEVAGGVGSTVQPLTELSTTPDSVATALTFSSVRGTVTAAALEANSRATVTAQAVGRVTATHNVQVASGATSTAVQIAAGTSTAQAVTQANAVATGVAQALASLTATAAPVAQAPPASQVPVPPQPQAPPPTAPTFAAMFETNFYHQIDFARAAREQGGAGVTLYSQCENLTCWYMKTARGKKAMDVNAAVASQFGPGWTAVAVGTGKDDWRAARFSDLSYVVLPVMMVASDKAWDVAGVNNGLGRLRSLLAHSQSWYYKHVGRTFRLMQPLVIISNRTAAQWESVTTMYADKNTLAQTAWSQYDGKLPPPGDNLRVVIAPYTGGSYAIEQSALSMPNFAVIPPLATSLTCAQSGPYDRPCQSATYLVDQALGLSFGLGHSCASYPSEPLCHLSIMQEGKPPAALLLQPEIDRLAKSPFFSRY